MFGESLIRIHHIGYLVKDIEKSEKEFLNLGYSIKQSRIYDDLRASFLTFVIKDGINIELVQPINAKSPIYPLLGRYKDSPYHICYECTDMEQTEKELLDAGYFVLRDKEMAPALDGREVIFMYKKGVGMIELCNCEKE